MALKAEEVYAILKKQIQSGGATPEQIQQAVDAYLEENPVQPGATVEQVAQIEKNKTDISELSEDIIVQQSKQTMPYKTVKGNKIVLNDVVVGSKMLIRSNSDYYIGGKNISLISDGTYLNDKVKVKGNKIEILSEDSTIDVFLSLINKITLNEQSNVFLGVWKNEGYIPIQFRLAKNNYGGVIGNGIDMLEEVYKSYQSTKGFDSDATHARVYLKNKNTGSFLYQIELNGYSEIEGETSRIAELKKSAINEFIADYKDICIQSVDGSEIIVTYIPFYKEKIRERKKHKIRKHKMIEKNIDESLQLNDVESIGGLYGKEKMFVSSMNYIDRNYAINELFTYSTEFIRGKSYPESAFVVKKNPRGTGAFVEFYYYGNELIVVCPRNSSWYFLADGIQVSDYISISGNNPTIYKILKLQFNSIKKRKITVFTSKWHGVFINSENEYIEKCYDSLYKPLICFDGDSITEASAKIGNKEVLYGYPAITTQLLDGKLYNCGVGGSGYVKPGNLSQPNMVDRYDSYIKIIEPDYLIVAGGLNDGMAEGIETAIDTYWNHVKETLKSGRAIVCSAFIPSPNPSEDMEKQTEILRKTALKYEFPFIDMAHGKIYDSFGNLLSSNIMGGVVTEENQEYIYDDYYSETSSDKTHPSAQGNIYLGKWMAQAIMIVAESDKGFLEVGTELIN